MVKLLKNLNHFKKMINKEVDIITMEDSEVTEVEIEEASEEETEVVI